MKSWSLLAGAALVVAALIGVTMWRAGIIALPHATGYFAPVFAPDGESVLAISREVRATVTGFGWEFFTPPARVRVLRDRFRLIEIRVSDRRVTVIAELPPSPLEGSRIRAYHGAIFGVPHAHLRWADANHLEYEIGVTRHDTPVARTFVVRNVWSPGTKTDIATAVWQEALTRLAGDEPEQLHGDQETMAVPGDELMPCAIALLRRDGSATMPLIETSTCQEKYAVGISPTVLMPISRRADIERAALIRTTYAGLVERGRSSGRSEGQSMLDANKEMQRRGLYPKTTTLIAERSTCDAQSPQFSISDAELTFGLFPDIEAAIKSPGTEIDKSMGAYITHRDYTTSRQINDYLTTGHSVFFARARGVCWRLTIHRH